MQNRKDLLQAHRLMTQRAALALLVGEPDSPNQPLRRRNTATVSSVLAGVIVAAVFGVLGLLSPGTVSGLTKPGTLAIDKNTGTSYVPCDGGELCPAVNYASARLALDTSSVNSVEVTQASLGHYRIGPAIGITGLPPDLPTSADLVKGPWSVCAANGVSTLVGGRAVGGAPLTESEATPATTPQGADWLLWNGERLQIDPDVMLQLFGIAKPPTVPVPWLDAIPQGPNFAAPAIGGQGMSVTGPGGVTAQVGQVYVAPGGTGQQYYVLEADGKLATATDVQAELLVREPGAPARQSITPSMATSDLSGTALPAGGLPAKVPAIAATSSPLCVVYGPGLSPELTAGGTVPAGAVAASGGAGVDQVWLPPDHGALVGVAPAVNDASGVTSWFLMTGSTRYGLPSSGVASVLGYSLPADQTVLPASVAELLPQGPVMDPAAATQQAPS